MDEQQVAATLLFPTLGVGIEEALRDDPEAAAARVPRPSTAGSTRTGGIAYERRIFAVPYVAAARPARPPSPSSARRSIGAPSRSTSATLRSRCRGGYRSPFDPVYDPFWGLAAEAGVVVATHAGIDGYDALVQMWEPGRAGELAVPFSAAGHRHQGPGGERLLRRRDLPQASSSGSRACAWPASRTGPRGSPTCSTGSTTRPTGTRLLRRAPRRDLRRARLGHAVLGGRRRDLARRRARRPAAARLGLAPRRGHPATGRLRDRDAGGSRRRRRAADRPRQRLGAARGRRLRADLSLRSPAGRWHWPRGP